MRSAPFRGIIACANLKGGVGKSTIAVSLAAALAERGRQVLLFDADQQRTSALWAERGRLPMAVRAHPWRAESVAADWRAEIAAAGATGIAVIDCPPSLEGATHAAVMLADLVLVPVTPSGADLFATQRALELVRAARAVRQGAPRVALVPSRVDTRTAVGRELAAALGDFGEPVAPAIGLRTKFVDCFTTGDWVGGFAPGSTAAAEVQRLTTSILEMLDDHPTEENA